MTTQRDTYTAANQQAWNASADFHRAGADWDRLVEGFGERGFSCLDAVETAALEELDVAGRDVVQICCNNARELLSVRNMGAARCVGFDQAGSFLEQGRELAAVAGQEIELVETDIYRIGAEYDGAFDLALITIGVFGWMPDLAAFMSLPARLLKPGGRLFIHEEHPVVNMFDPEARQPLEPTIDYFRKEPLKEEGAIVYDGSATPQDEALTHWWFVHTLADVMTAALDAGFTLERYREFPNNISSVEFDIYQNRQTSMPMSYTMVWRR
jgi:SAM-dependent methyltransferase